MEEGQRRRRKEWKEIRKLMERVGYSENECERLSQFVCLSVFLSCHHFSHLSGRLHSVCLQ